VVTVNNEVPDEHNRYIPQPTSLDFVLLKVIIDKIPLMIPMTNIIIVITALTFTLKGCSDKLRLCLNS
jgi:hypothetical protein